MNRNSFPHRQASLDRGRHPSLRQISLVLQRGAMHPIDSLIHLVYAFLRGHELINTSIRIYNLN